MPAIYTGRRTGPTAKKPFIGEETARWLSSLLIVLAVYAVPFAWWLRSSPAPEVSAPPAAAMVVELAPLPAAPPQPAEIPVDNERPEETPPPEPEPQKAEPEPEPVPEVEKAEAVIPPKEAPPEEEDPQPPEESPPPPSASQEAPQVDDVAAAPVRGVPSPGLDASRIPSWQNQLMLRLNEAKRYPTRARRYRQEGVTYLRFTMDRDGRVLEKSIDQGSGYRLLDREALALIERAQPLPKPPEALKGDTLEFVVPVEFFLNR
ncbi:energy transducer TonB [Microbulbifer taiwanensis]|uniref:Energy transducer TonB n=1 Tax=Microbulbifer taiwanensis TaxID=986746 RepID=A0ABW1YMQ2_9GAMM|nr:energy transducer TonB [Microbulbifer taiwanensis]